MIGRRENIVANTTVLARLPNCAFRITSWSNTRSPKARAVVYTWCQNNGYAIESVFDTKALPHTRRYIALMYNDAAERKACFDHIRIP